MPSFSEDELNLIADRNFFERKVAVSNKIRGAYAQLRDELKDYMKPETYLAPEGVDFTQGKISGGEKQYDLPYLFLDFPRRFSKEAIFAYRSIFWWGHYFLFTLILSGELLPEYQKRISQGWKGLATREDYVAVTNDPFEWRHQEKFFRVAHSISQEPLEKELRNLPFLKLITFIPFSDPRIETGALVKIGLQTFQDWEFIFTR